MGGERLKGIAAYAGTAFLSLGILTWVLQLWKANLRIPFAYDGDALFYSMIIKAIVQKGWYLQNDYLGMPGGQYLYDYPMADSLHFFIVKILSWFTRDYALLLNCYYILTFPLTALIALAVLRQFKVTYGHGIIASLLYAFVPYHFYRGEFHFCLAAYYLTPLAILLAIWIQSGEQVLVWRNPESTRFGMAIKDRKSILAVVICILISSAGVYYAFFACFLLIVAGLAGYANRKDLRPALTAAAMVLIISLGVAANVVPTIRYEMAHGKNREAAHRYAWESERFGLKVMHLILPIEGHRARFLAKLRNKYNQDLPEVNESALTSLGAIGAIGFLALLAWFLFGERITPSGSLLRHLGLLNLSALLLGTVGGLGSMFAFFISPNIRCYNRISIYIAFLSLAAVAILLDRLLQYRRKTIGTRLMHVCALTVLLLLGVLDQTNAQWVPNYADLCKQYRIDDKFIREIEALLPAKSMILQLPYFPFPEHEPVQKLQDYQLLRPYLHSTSLRWSYAAMKGRESDLWQREVARKPVDEMVTNASLVGFTGICIDRLGYADGGTELERQLLELLKTQPLVSDDQRLVFFAIGEKH